MAPTTTLRAMRPIIRTVFRTSRIPVCHSRRPILASPAATSLNHFTNHSTSSKSSVDPTEVSHFNALASSWWDPHGPSRLLHLMNPLRHEFINRCRSTSTPSASDSNQKLRYLDIGCGGGIFAESAARLPSTESVTAIDPTPEVLKVAEAHKRRDPTLCEQGRLSYLNKSIEDLEVPQTREKQYDVVTLFEVLEHVSHPSSFLASILPHVAPGGWLILSTIARTTTAWMITNVMAEDVLRIVPKGTHDWKKYVNESELKEWFAKQEGWGGRLNGGASGGGMRSMGVMYVPGLGWREVSGGEAWGNYFFGVRKEDV